ncbi:MMS19 nucleotide excision repair protein homolog [Antedon mediterranea]|uniref:MMS19 nucleotide excision repair protein homolog n=1 Tax=Antedon mediterranea TaxID=105859 RepID=UPI003AF552FF
MAAPVWQASIEDYVWGNQESALLTITNGVNNDDIKLLTLIEYLGQHLLSTDHDIRARATRFLSEVLHNIPNDKFSTPEVGHLVAFYCDRLKDHHSVTPHALLGLLALSDCKYLANGDEVLIVQAILKEVHVQTLMQVDRRSVFNIIARFLDTRLTELKKLGNDFVYGYMQAMDGEKDPRNLMIVFRCIPIIIQNFQFERFCEELFEVTSCYFPIDFAPHPNDPHGVTTQELILGLRKCLSATSKFAQFCLPMLMEKVSSDIPSAKLDSFQTLTACAKSYDALSFSGYMEAIWSACRREVFQAVNKDIEMAALESLHHVVKNYSSGIFDNSSTASLDSSLDTIIRECKQFIQEPELRLIQPCCALLRAVAGASDPACCKVVQTIIPQLLEQYRLSSQATTKLKIIDVIIGLLSVTMDTCLTTDVSHPAVSMKDDIITILCEIQQDSHSELRQIGVRGFGVLVMLNGLLDVKDVDLVGEHLIKGFFNDNETPVRVQCSQSLSNMSSKHSDVVKMKLMPELSNLFQTGVVPMENQNSPVSTESIINMLATIATYSDLIRSIIPLLLDYIFSIGKDFDSENIISTSLQSILVIVEKTNNNHADIEFYLKSLIPRLVEKLVRSCTVTEETTELFMQENIVKHCTSIIRSISQMLDVRLAEDLSKSVLKGIATNDFTSFGFRTDDPDLKLLSVKSPWQQTQLISIILATVCSVHKDAIELIKPELREELFTLATESDHGYTQTTAAQCLAAILNKCQSDEDLLTILSSYKSRLEVILNETHQDKEVNSLTAMTTWNWITKALVLRGHSMASEFISTMISYLGNEALGHIAAEGFKCVLTEDVLTPASHANVKIMYCQRFFLETISKISSGFQLAKDECKRFYLQAMSHLFQNVTKAVLLSELPPLIPMMVHSLLCEDTTLNLSTLKVLLPLIKDAPQVISKDVDALLMQMMKLAERQDSMVVRIAALECIGDMTSLPHHIVFPYKEKLKRFLGKCLDDKKRMVRKKVVNARNKWFLLGELKS